MQLSERGDFFFEKMGFESHKYSKKKKKRYHCT